MPGIGWSTFDPTPPDPQAASGGLLMRANLYLDAAGTFWREWVMAYGLTHQGALAYRMEERARRAGLDWFGTFAALRSRWETGASGWARRIGWREAGWLAGLLAACLVLRPAIRLLRVRQRVERVRRGEATVPDATMLYARMLRLLKRRGYQKPPWFTPVEFAASLPESALARDVGEFTATYNALRFGGHAGAASKLTSLLDRMERK